jgi:hypothetical protein
MRCSGVWLSWMQQRGSRRKEEDPPFPPAAAEIHAAVSFNSDSLVRSSYADDPDLVQLVSVADLRRTPGLTALDFSWFAFGDTPSLGSLSPLEGEHPPSGSLSREPMAGKLPWGFMPRRDPNPALHTRDVDHDYRHSWVQPSHFCKGGGMGLFLYVPRGQVLPAGTLLVVHSGSGESLKIKYKEAQKLFRASVYVVDHSPSSYVVDGENKSTICAPMTTLTLSTVTLHTTHSTSKWKSSRISPCRRVITNPSRTMKLLGKLRATTGPPSPIVTLARGSCSLSCVLLPLTI